jgi:hypothetical protein
MTTPADFGLINLVPFLNQVTDRASLQLVSRMLDAQVTVVEAQLAQLKQVQEAVQEHLGRMGPSTAT